MPLTLRNVRNPKIRCFLSVLLIPGLFILISQEGAAQDDEPYLSLGEKRELYSNVLEESRDIIVGLPSGYKEDDESYSVVYLLDPRNHFHHVTGSTRFLARIGRMPAVIVVAIPNTDRTRDLTPPTQVNSNRYPTAGGADNFLEFISEELKPYIKENYRTRPYSILIGHSLGGLFANHALVHRPEVFNAYISISPSMHWDEQRLVAQADSAFDHMGGLVGDFYMTIGNEGGAMLDGALKFVAVLEEKAPDSFRWEFKHMEEESHSSVPYLSTYYGLETIFEGWYLHDPVDLYETGGLAGIDRHFELASKRFGYERSASGVVLTRIGIKALEDEQAADAVAIFSRIIEQQPNLGLGHYGLADANALMGNKDIAIEHYKHALNIDPRNGEAREKLVAYGVDLSLYPEKIDVPIHLMESYVGRYSESDFEHEIVLEDEKLYFEYRGRRKHELYATSRDRFKFVVGEVYITFKTDGAGSISSMLSEEPGSTVEAFRIK